MTRTNKGLVGCFVALVAMSLDAACLDRSACADEPGTDKSTAAPATANAPSTTATADAPSVTATANAPSAPAAANAPSTPSTSPTSPKRALPDYDGRGAPPTTAGEVALWIPRILLSPLYFVTEWLIRRPLGAAESAAERAGLPETLFDFFAFGPDHKAGVFPIAFFDFGFNPSIGAYGFWNDAFFKGNDLRAHVSFWTDDWVGGSLVDRARLPGKGSVELEFLAITRPDHAYFGTGPDTLQSARSRYGELRIDGGALVDFPLWRSSRVDAGLGVRSATFRDGHFGDDPGILQSVAANAYPLPDGFARGYTVEYNDVLLAVDSRRKFPEQGSGVRLEAQAEQGNDLQSPSSGWIHYGAGAGLFWDVNGARRVIGLSALAMFSDPLGPTPVPFTELVTLGGDLPAQSIFPAPMPGFFPGRLIDRSGTAATLSYRWPIGPWLSGSLQGAVGNVFGEHLEGFDTRLLRASGAIGIESDSSPDSSFELLFGIGTETFAHGGQVDSFRLAVGLTRF